MGVFMAAGGWGARARVQIFPFAGPRILPQDGRTPMKNLSILLTPVALFSMITLPLYLFSLLVLYGIFIQGQWPTYNAHIAIAIAFFITIGQLIVASKQRSAA